MKTLRAFVLGIVVFAVTGVMAQSATPEVTEEPGLSGSSWLLTATSGQDHQTLVLPGSSITLTFEDSSHISGDGGCNTYAGNYTLGEAGEIVLSGIVSTLRACADTSMSTQESIFLGALNGVTHYERSDRELALRIDDVESLHFVRVDQDPLAGTAWTLINEVPADLAATPEVGLMAQPITLAFDADGQATGHGGCNTYSTMYTLDGTGITFSEVVSTRMACEDGDIMQREQAFFAALSSAAQYGLTDDRLYIRYDDGSRLAFERVAVPALQAVPLSGAPGSTVELTGSGFAPNSGIVIGFGPYVGDVYQTIAQAESDADGAFVVIVAVPAVDDPTVEYVFMAAVPGTARTLSEPFAVTGD